MIGTIVNAVLFAFAAICILVGVLKGRKNPWQKTVARLVCILLSAVTSILIAKLIASATGSAIYEIVKTEVFTEELAELPEALPSLEAIMTALVCIILCPIIFCILLLIFRGIFAIISHFVMKAIIKEEPKPAPKAAPAAEEQAENSEAGEVNEVSEAAEGSEDAPAPSPKPKKSAGLSPKAGRAISMAVGAVCGIVIFVISWAPLTGALGLFGSVTDALKEQEFEDIEEITEISDSITGSAAVKVTNAMGGRLVFNSLTSAKASGVKIVLEKEIDSAIIFLQALTTVTEENVEKDAQVSALRSISAAFDNSSLIPLVTSEFLAGASDAWSRGEAFCGIDAPVSDDSAMGTFLASVLEGFKDSTVDTIKADVNTIIEVASLVIENDVMDSAESDVSALLADTEFMRSLLLEILENPHTAEIANDGLDFFMQLFASSALGAKESIEPLYDSLLADVAELMQNPDVEDIAKEIKSVFNGYGISLTDESATLLATELGGKYGISAQDVQNALDNNELTINLTDKTQTNVYINNKEALVEHSVLVTTEQLSTKHSQITNPEEEVDKLVDTIASLPELIEAMEEDSSDIPLFMKNIGAVLDKFASSELIGKDCTDTLVLMIFQSDILTDVLSLDKVSTTGAANTIIRGAETKSYATVMEDLAKTVDALISLGESEDLKNDDSIKNLLDTITVESAEVIEHMIDSELISSLGVNEKSAETMSEMVTSTLNKLASIKEEGTISEEQYNAEIESITYLINTALDVSTGEGEDSEILISEYVDTILDSEVVTSTVIEAVYGEGGTEAIHNPLEIEFEPTEEEKQELTEALTTKLNSASEEDKETMEMTITAIASLINVEVVIENGTVILP